MTTEYRIATATDLPQIADLRWRLRVDDEPVSDRAAYHRFIADFVRICESEWQPHEIVHWIATDVEHVIAVMSVVFVRKLPSPENLRDRWGYICKFLRSAGTTQLRRRAAVAKGDQRLGEQGEFGASRGVAERARVSILCARGFQPTS